MNFTLRAVRALVGIGITLPLFCGRVVAAQGDGPEDRYAFLVGLCEAREWRLAAEQARTFLKDYPSNDRADLARYRLATALFESGDRRAAREEYARLAQRADFEFGAETRFRLGQCELTLEHFDAAAQQFASVRGGGGYLAPAATFFLAEAQFARGDFAAADQAYASVLESGSASEYARDARYGRAWCAFRSQRWSELLQRGAEFLQRHAQDSAVDEIRYLMGEARLATGDPDAALASFDSVRGGEFRARAMRGAGFASVAKRDHVEAARRFAALLREFPQSEFASEARLQLGVAGVLSGDFRGASAALAVEAGGDAEAAYWLARAQRGVGDATAALASVERASKGAVAQELAERLRLLRGELLSDLGREGEAAQVFAAGSTPYARYAAAIAAFNGGELERASQFARSALAADPESEFAAELHLIVGEAELAAERPAQALSSFEAALSSSDPSLVRRAASRVAFCRFTNGDFDGAARGFRSVAEQDERNAETSYARYMLGSCCERAGRTDDAVAAWRGYLARDPTGANAADVLAGLARLDEAHAGEWAARLVREFPESQASAAALIDRADAAARAGRAEEAIAGYRSVLERFPSHADAAAARYGLAWALFESGQFAESAAEVAQLVALPTLPSGTAESVLELEVWLRCRLLERSAIPAAFERFALSGADAKRKLAAAQVASAALSKAGDAAAAAHVFDVLLPRAGDRSVQTSILLESCFLALDGKDVDEAEARLRTAWKLAPQEFDRAALGEAAFFVAEARFERGEDPRACDLYERALEAADAALRPAALYKLGFVRLRGEQFEEAASHFERVANEAPQHELAGESLYLAGEALARAGRWQRAITDLQRLIELHPEHASVNKALFRVGVASGELGQWETCERSLAQLARRAPKFEGAAEADLWRGRAAAARSDARAAKAAFERVCAADRGRFGALARIELGRLSSAAGEHEDALAQFLKVALLYEKSDVVAEASLGAAGELEALDQREKALERYRAVAAEYPDTPFAQRAQQRVRELSGG